jgi:alanyl-tRNA synthetase
MLIAVVTKDLSGRYHAGNIVKEIASVVGGRGGGRPDMAQAGGNQPENLDQALEKVYEVVGKRNDD